MIILPDSLIAREIIEKKLDLQIMYRLTQVEIKNNGNAFFHKKKKDINEENMSPTTRSYQRYGSLLIGNLMQTLDSSKSMMNPM